MRNIEELIDRQMRLSNSRGNSIMQVLKYAPGQTPGEGAARVVPGSVRHPPICVSREIGSGARVICRDLCERLGYGFFGSSIIDEIAKDLNVQRRLVESLDEHGRGELELLLESLLSGREIETAEYMRSLIKVVKSLGRGGGVVLLGRGANFILREHSALNVLVVAPLEVRIRRLATYCGLTEAQAREEVIAKDRQREQFLRKSLGVDIHQPRYFDLVINTGRIPPERGIDIIMQALSARGFSPQALAIPGESRAGKVD